MNNNDESEFDEILRELDEIRELASNYTLDEIRALYASKELIAA